MASRVTGRDIRTSTPRETSASHQEPNQAALMPAAIPTSIDLLRRLQAEQGFALAFITHDLAVARQMSDRIIVMKDGAIVEEGATEALLAAPSHPYTASLIDAVPGRGAPA